VTAAHDLSLGGLGVALFRLLYDPAPTVRRMQGFAFSTEAFGALADAARQGRAGDQAHRKDLLLFGETNGCALVACGEVDRDRIKGLAAECGVPALAIGRTTAREANGGAVLDWGAFQLSEADLVRAYEHGLAGVL
jgi:hypothetical protein